MRGAGAVVPLENGERLSAAAFLRRYEAMPGVKKAELIEGVVYMGSPVRLVHAEPDNLVQLWLGLYAARTPGTRAAANGTVRLDADNVLQPDAFLRLTEDCGGTAQVDGDSYLQGAPELVVEIAASSSAIDLHDKLRAYRRNGVKEYLVWRTLDGELDWFVLEEGEYARQQPDGEGLCRSAQFPGLVLNVPALLAQEGAKVIASLSTALDSAEHREFLRQLAERRSAAER
jgi:Uma2 family endonuclease